MSYRRAFRSYAGPVRAAAAAAFALLAACGDSSGPDGIIALRVVSARIDSATFQATGEITLGLIATNPDGSLIPPENLTVAAELADGSPAALVSLTSSPPEGRPVAAAINLDDSRSMNRNDPERRRADAARLFWESLFDTRAANQAALLDFSGRPPSAGFGFTRLLHGWTSDRTSLAALLDSVRATPELGTPLFRSAIEVAAWIDSTRPAASFKRVMVVMTDGLPSDEDPAFRDSAVANARNRGIVIHAVGLGPASSESPDSDPAAVAALRALAEGTGGLYVGAPDAEALGPVFRTLAEVSLRGELFAVFRLSPVPPPGAGVALRVRASKGRRTASAAYAFVAP